jgi:hypothetical protein
MQSLDWGDDPDYCWFVDCGHQGPSSDWAGNIIYPTEDVTYAGERIVCGGNGTDWLGTREQGVYADGRPLGAFDPGDNVTINVNAAYSVMIAGLNYYSILETMPLVDAETIGRPTSIKSVAIDFFETMGAHVGSDADHASDWTFSVDDFATAITPYTGYKPPTGYSPFMRGMNRQPVVYVYEYDPIPMTIRSITANMEVTIE